MMPNMPNTPIHVPSHMRTGECSAGGMPVKDNLLKMIKLLGADYGIKRIDFEDCVYRDLGDFDIEISGCGRKRGPFDVYVRQKQPLRIVYQKHNIRNHRELKIELNRVMEMHEARKQSGVKWSME